MKRHYRSEVHATKPIPLSICVLIWLALLVCIAGVFALSIWLDHRAGPGIDIRTPLEIERDTDLNNLLIGLWCFGILIGVPVVIVALAFFKGVREWLEERHKTPS